MLRSVRADLTAHCGGAPSATQRALIERVAWLSLRVARIDRSAAEGRGMTEHDDSIYPTWANALARTLAQIGPPLAAPPAAPSPTESPRP